MQTLIHGPYVLTFFGGIAEIVFDDDEGPARRYEAFVERGPRGVYLAECEPPLPGDVLADLADAIERAEAKDARA